MDPHIFQPGARADAPPGMLKIGQVGARPLADDNPGIALRAGQGGKHACRRPGQRHHPGASLAVAQPKLTRL